MTHTKYSFLTGIIYFKGRDLNSKFTLICFLIGYYRNWLNNTLGCVFFVHITYHVSVPWCRWLPTSNWLYFLPAFFRTIYFSLWSSPLQNVATAYEHVNEKYSIWNACWNIFYLTTLQLLFSYCLKCNVPYNMLQIARYM